MRLRYFLLLVFLFLTLGPLLLFRAWPHSEVLQGELDEVHERHLLLARNLAAALERYHQDLVTTFDLLLDSPDVWSNQNSMNQVLTNLSFRHVCIVDWDSGRVMTALALETAPCPDVIPVDMLNDLKGLVEPDAVGFGPVVVASNGENVIHLVKRTGEQLAVGVIQTTYFRELGEAISFGVMGHAAIVDHTGRALSHPLEEWVEIRKDMAKISAVQRMLNRETGVETFYSPALEGDMIAGFTFVDPVGWGVMIPQPIAELYQKAAAARQSSIIVLLIGTIAALGFAMVVSFRVVRPLEEISEASSSVAQGDFSFPKPNTQARFLPSELRELQHRFHDMVQRLRENMSMINALAYVDGVTGLGNRAFLQECLDRNLAKGRKGALLLIDLDGFKSVNDLFGHEVGDLVLEVVASRICKELGVDKLGETEQIHNGSHAGLSLSGTFVTRMGGDEFAIWLENVSRNKAVDIAEKLVAQLGKPIVANGFEAKIGASLGVAMHPVDAEGRSNLLKAADLAMYEAKRAGKNQFVSFTPALKTGVTEKRKLGEEIAKGLEKGQFIPFFQPQFSLPDRQLSGVEALARWIHPERGILGPPKFLDAALDAGLLMEIDATIFEQSVRLMSNLAKTGSGVESLAINVSEKRLNSPDFINALGRLPALPFELRFELAETMVLDKVEGHMAWTLDQVREHGHHLDLDDFGSANASVLGLMNVEPAHLKIDRNLVLGIEPGNVAERLVRSIVEMGHCLGIPIIAEGAEDIECIEALERMQCDYVQGFALAKPMTFDALVAFMHNGAHDRMRRQPRGAG